MARILLGVTGGIAAYKALEFVRLATGAGHAVRVIQTRSSQRFVGAGFVRRADRRAGARRRARRRPPPGGVPRRRGAGPRAGQPPRAGLQRRPPRWSLRRRPTRWPSWPTAWPTTSCRRRRSPPRCPVVLAPAMNDRMYEHPATQANVELLRARGATVLDPGRGRLGSPGEWGVGRLVEPADLLAACEALLAGAGGRRRGSRRWRSGGPAIQLQAPRGLRLPRRSGPIGLDGAARRGSGLAGAGDAPAGPASRSTRSATWRTARPGGWASPWPTRPRPGVRR